MPPSPPPPPKPPRQLPPSAVFAGAVRDRVLRLGRHLLPASCALCGSTAQSNVCAACSKRYLTTTDTHCAQCAIPLPGPAADPVRCGGCLSDPPAFDHTVAVTAYAAPVDQLVLALKFGGQLALARTMADLLHARMVAAGTPAPDIIVPVPLAPARLAARGFNQALEIARPLSRRLGIALQPRLLVRVRDTLPQSALRPEDRRRNVKQAFTVSAQAVAAMQGKHLALVDDVMTTGETLAEIATVLKRFGAARVTNLVFTRTPPKN